jgi:hypothetical protein
VEVDQLQVVGIGSQKEMISNFGKNERIHLQVKMETEQEEPGGIQKLLQQEKNQFFHVGLFGKKRETKADG